MANLTVKNNTYQPIGLRPQQSKVGYNGAQIVDQSGIYGQMGKASGAVLKIIQDKEESDETERILNANNEFAKRVADIKLGIETNMQGSNAKNAAALYEQQVEEARKDVYANSGLKYKAGENTFNRNAFAAITRGAVWAQEWEKAQTDKAKATTYDLSVDDEIDSIIGGTATFEEGFTNSMRNAAGLFPSMPKEQREVMTRATADKMGGTLVSQAIDRNDYGLATEIFDYFSPNMTSATRAKLSSAIYQNQEYTENADFVNEAISLGITTEEGFEDYLKNKTVAGMKGKYTFNQGVSFTGAQKVTMAGTEDLTTALNSFGVGDIYITSINDSTDIHAGGTSGAEHTHGGGYKIDIASDTLANMMPQERAALIARIKQALPGVRIINEYDDPSANSTGGHFDVDFTEYRSRGDYSGMSAMRSDKLKKMFTSTIAANEAKVKRAANAADAAFVQQTYEWQQQGLSYDNAIKLATQAAGGNWARLNGFTKNINRMYGVSGNGSGASGGKADQMMMDYLGDQLTDKKFSALDELLEAASLAGASGKQIYNLSQEWAKYEKGEGKYSFDWNGSIKQQIVGDIKGTDNAKSISWENDKLALQNDFIPRYRERNGRDPSNYEVIEAGREALIKQPIGTVKKRGTYINYEEEVSYSAADLSGAGITSIVQVDDKYFRAVMKNGEIKTVNADELQRIVGQ